MFTHGAPRLRGRRNECATLDRLLESVRPGSSQVLVLRGEAGVGKAHLRGQNDPRDAITDPEARYFGARLAERTLLPGDDAMLGEISLEAWRSEAAPQAAAATR